MRARARARADLTECSRTNVAHEMGKFAAQRCGSLPDCLVVLFPWRWRGVGLVDGAWARLAVLVGYVHGDLRREVSTGRYLFFSHATFLSGFF